MQPDSTATIGKNVEIGGISMTIDMALLSVLITLILAVLAGGYFLGKLTERVHSNRLEIDENKREAIAYRKENREEHAVIVSRLDRLISNGGGQA